MSLASERRSNLNPNAPLFIPAAVRQVEDFSPEWWQLVTTSTWFHDYWIGQQQQQGEDGFFGNTADDRDIVDMLPDSIDTDEEDILSMEDQYEQFLLSSASKQMPSNGLEREAETLIRSLNLPKSTTPRPQVEKAKYPERPVKSFSPKIGSQRIQQPR